jgi:hypothetical protein
MKKLLLLFVFVLISFIVKSQCDINRCIGENLSLTHNTTASSPIFSWQSSLPFTGQGTGTIQFTSLPVGNFQAILTVTDGITGCTNSDTINVCVIQGVATLVLPQICQGEPCIPVSGGSGVGVYTINGVVVTQLCEANDGQTVTFTSNGACPGVATDVFNVNPKPNVTIIPN